MTASISNNETTSKEAILIPSIKAILQMSFEVDSIEINEELISVCPNVNLLFLFDESQSLLGSIKVTESIDISLNETIFSIESLERKN